MSNRIVSGIKTESCIHNGFMVWVAWCTVGEYLFRSSLTKNGMHVSERDAIAALRARVTDFGVKIIVQAKTSKVI